MTRASETGGVGVSVKVLLLGEIKRLAGRLEVDLWLEPGATMKTLARALRDACAPAFARRILTTDCDFQSHVAVFLNGAHLQHNGDTETPLEDGQIELMVMPIYEGGS